MLNDSRSDVDFLKEVAASEYRSFVEERITKTKASRAERFLKELGKSHTFTREQAKSIISFLERLYKASEPRNGMTFA